MLGRCRSSEMPVACVLLAWTPPEAQACSPALGMSSRDSDSQATQHLLDLLAFSVEPGPQVTSRPPSHSLSLTLIKQIILHQTKQNLYSWSISLCMNCYIMTKPPTTTSPQQRSVEYVTDQISSYPMRLLLFYF